MQHSFKPFEWIELGKGDDETISETIHTMQLP
jgi:hypothetical protein